MAKIFAVKLATNFVLVASCLFLFMNERTEALFLSNLINCNSFACRLSALESDVNLLKQQVNRLTGGHDPTPMNNGMGNFRPGMLPNQGGFNQLPNQGGQFNQGQQGTNLNPNNMNNQQQQLQNQQQNQQGNSPTVSYGVDYSPNQQLRRVTNFPNNPTNQFLRA